MPHFDSFLVRFLTATSFTVCALWGQGGATGALSGVVLDGQGGAVSAAVVDITSSAESASHRKVLTDNNGLFAASLLPPGVYSLKVSAPGFAVRTARDVAVRVTETTRLNIALDVAATQQAIDVHADVSKVETATATTGQSLDSGVIGALPLATQNFQQLLTLSTGAAAAAYRAVVPPLENNGPAGAPVPETSAA